MKKKTQKIEETYLVKFHYLSNNGYYKFRQEDITIKVNSPKSNHKLAEKAIIEKYKQYKEVKVTSVTYI